MDGEAGSIGNIDGCQYEKIVQNVTATRQAMKAIIFLFLFSPLALQAQVYRCDGPDGPIYSQIPCEDNAEQVAILDLQGVTGSDVGDPEGRQEPEAIEETPTDRLNTFIATLEKQRRAHIDQINHNIETMNQQMASDDFTSTDNATKEEFRKSLLGMEMERDSIPEQYDALIDEAERRTAQ